MTSPLIRPLGTGLALILCVVFLASGCATVKKWTGMTTPDEEEMAREAKAAAVTPQVGEPVVIDGKTYIRSRNPYYLTYPAEPEYIYVEKGKEFVGLSESMSRLRERWFGKGGDKSTEGIPPEKVQELVRLEVDRILREQGRSGELFVSKVKSASPFSGRAVAVVPALKDTPKGYDGLNLTLANNLRADLGRQRDLVVIPESAGKEGQVQIIGKVGTPRNIQALGNALGVQGVVVTQVIPPGYKDSSGYMAMTLYETFNGAEVKTILEPFGAGTPKTDAAQSAVTRSSTLLANEIRSLEWFGRIEFLKGDQVYVNVGNNTGLKPGKLLTVVQPGKEVRNPQTNAVLGFTGDVSKGDLRVTQLLGSNAAAAVPVSGGPFQPNDLVKPK